VLKNIDLSQQNHFSLANPMQAEQLLHKENQMVFKSAKITLVTAN